MNDQFRIYCSFCFCVGLLAFAFGLAPLSYSQTFQDLTGAFTKITGDSFDPSSIILKGDAKITQKSTFQRLLEKPLQSLRTTTSISSPRLATLAKGALRFGAYGMMVDAGMTVAGWVWDDLLKNWKKTETVNTNQLPSIGCGMKIGDIGWGWGSDFATSVFWQLQSFYCNAQNLTGDMNCGHPELCPPGKLYRAHFVPVSLPNNQLTKTASDQDIFDTGVRVNSPDDVVDSIIAGLPQVIGTPLEQLKIPSPVGINWPEIVNVLQNIVNNFVNSTNIFDIVNEAFNDGPESLTQEQTDFLEQNNIDIDTLINAINKTINNQDLTSEEKNQLNLLNNTQDVTKFDPNPESSPAPDTGADPVTTSIPDSPIQVDVKWPETPIKVDIPTDCDLIPFVCDWLTWFRGWLTDDPPPIPESVIPIEPLDDFDPADSPSGSCPVPYQFQVFGRDYQVSYQPFCDLALLLNPLVVAIGWLLAGFIVTRSR